MTPVLELSPATDAMAAAAAAPGAAPLVDPTRIARRRRHRVRVPRPVARLTGPVLVMVLWQLASTFDVLSANTIPAPSAVWDAFRAVVASGQLQTNLAASLSRVLKGLTLGITCGLVLAIVAGLSRMGENIIDTNMEVVRAVPAFALVPILMVWFGIGEQPKVVLISITVTVAIYINTYSAIRNVDAGLVEAARTFGVGDRELVHRVILPGALPGFLVGLRLALTGSWLALIFAESINAPKGLGQTMTDAREYFQLNVMFVLIAVYATLGLISLTIVRLLERRFLRWRRSYGDD